MCDIRRLGAQIADRLAVVSRDTTANRFDASSVPPVPQRMTSGSVVIRRGHHDYNGCWRADSLQLYATRQTLRSLGVIVLASLFATPEHATDIALTHPATDIATLRVRTPPLTTGGVLARRPSWYDYWPQEWAKFPWSNDALDPDHLPAVYLTDDDELGGITGAQWQNRDTVVGFGSQEGVARFGQFLLDVGNPAHPGDEYRLEGEAGVRGVAPMSAELCLWLPGSSGWEPSQGLA
jgi:hypothetical protein